MPGGQDSVADGGWRVRPSASWGCPIGMAGTWRSTGSTSTSSGARPSPSSVPTGRASRPPSPFCSDSFVPSRVTVQVLGRAPAEPWPRAWSARCCNRDRDRVRTAARGAGRRDALRLVRTALSPPGAVRPHRGARRHRSAPASPDRPSLGRGGAAGALRPGHRRRPRSGLPRRADVGHGRREPTFVLADDAGVRPAGPHHGLRHPPPRRGRRDRRPGRRAEPRPGGGRRPRRHAEGGGGQPAGALRRRPSGPPDPRPVGGSDRRGRPRHRLWRSIPSTPTPPSGPWCTRASPSATWRSPGPASSRRSWPSPTVVRKPGYR